MEDHEIELIDYLRVLWRQKWVIAVTFVVAVAAALAAVQGISPTYQTQTSLLILPPLSGQLDAEAVGSRLTPEAYQQLAVSTSILQMVIEKVDSLESTSLQSLKGRFSVTVKRLSSEGELLLSATIRGPNAIQLPEIAAAWTEAFTETYGELFQDRIARSYEYVSANFEETETELEQLLEERRAFLLDNPVDFLQIQVDALRQDLITNRSLLDSARLEESITETRVAALIAELALQPLAYTLTSSIAPDSLVAAGLATRDIDKLAGIRTEREELNETHVAISHEVAFQRARLRELREEMLLREAEAVQLRDELDATQDDLTNAQVLLADYDRRMELLTVSHARLASSLQDAKLALAETPEPIRVIDEPLVPGSPIAPRKTTNIAIAGFLGLMLGTLLAFFADYLGRVDMQKAPATLSMQGSTPSDRNVADNKAERDGKEDG
jgi:polysaccharide biosynthesis transport protein